MALDAILVWPSEPFLFEFILDFAKSTINQKTGLNKLFFRSVNMIDQNRVELHLIPVFIPPAGRE